MPELSFRVTGARAEPWAASPQVVLAVEISTDAPVRSLLLSAQVRIDAPRRSYSPEEQRALQDLFGEPSLWSRSLQGLLWANASAVVRPFEARAEVELPVPVTFELSVAAAKYFEGVEGDVPLLLLFSGTVFHERADGALQVAPLPWVQEAGFAFPASVWRRTLDLYFPNRAALEVDRGVLERLRRYQRAQGLPSVDRALEALLGGAA